MYARMRYQLRVHEKWYTLKSYQIISLNETIIFIPFERMMLNNTMRTPYSFISLFISWLHPFHLTIYMYTRMYTIIFFKLAEVWLSSLSMKKSSTFWTRVRLPRVATNGLYKYTSTLMPQFSVSILSRKREDQIRYKNVTVLEVSCNSNGRLIL